LYGTLGYHFIRCKDESPLSCTWFSAAVSNRVVPMHSDATYLIQLTNILRTRWFAIGMHYSPLQPGSGVGGHPCVGITSRTWKWDLVETTALRITWHQSNSTNITYSSTYKMQKVLTDNHVFCSSHRCHRHSRIDSFHHPQV
jgi:hypothetical protein